MDIYAFLKKNIIMINIQLLTHIKWYSLKAFSVNKSFDMLKNIFEWMRRLIPLTVRWKYGSLLVYVSINDQKEEETASLILSEGYKI